MSLPLEKTETRAKDTHTHRYTHRHVGDMRTYGKLNWTRFAKKVGSIYLDCLKEEAVASKIDQEILIFVVALKCAILQALLFFIIFFGWVERNILRWVGE